MIRVKVGETYRHRGDAMPLLLPYDLGDFRNPDEWKDGYLHVEIGMTRYMEDTMELAGDLVTTPCDIRKYVEPKLPTRDGWIDYDRVSSKRVFA